MSESEIVATFGDAGRANIAAMFLRSNGLLVMVQGDDAGGAFAGLNLSGGFQLRVPVDQVDVALELLANPNPDENDASSLDG
ncbi:MAG: hypothetical protein NZ777_01465 [Pseudomonadales bacterium]|nr:hypothetical protein [Pseudomonadales bacterium]